MLPLRSSVFRAIGAPSFMLPCELPITVLDPRDAGTDACHNLLRQWFTAIHDMPNLVAPTVADGSAMMRVAAATVSGRSGQSEFPVIAAIPVGLGGARMNRTMAALRVLVVEDDALIGELLAEMLIGMGHDVCAVELTEGGAVAAAARFKPDLMIVDVQLGDGNGVDAVTTIHRSGPVPHVFVSGDISRVKLPWPGSVIIQKPYREADLARVIQRALDAPPALS